METSPADLRERLRSEADAGTDPLPTCAALCRSHVSNSRSSTWWTAVTVGLAGSAALPALDVDSARQVRQDPWLLDEVAGRLTLWRAARWRR